MQCNAAPGALAAAVEIRVNNRKGTSLALLLIGLVSVNFFYLSDILFDEDMILLGRKSVVSIIAANLITLFGIIAVLRDRSRR
jgi:lipopolysaccharide export LptBFGC system permease protein LptF